jgi:RNA polymerase sigma factor (sigma-70 family)
MRDADLDRLVATWRRPLFALALARLGDPDEADDVVQTVLLRVVRGRHLARADDPGAYLRTAVENLCRSVLVRRRRGPPLPEVEAQAVIPAGSIDEVGALLRDAIRMLPHSQRAVVWLVHVEGVAPGEVAHLLAARPNAIKAALARGRQTLRRRLAPILRKAGYLAL